MGTPLGSPSQSTSSTQGYLPVRAHPQHFVLSISAQHEVHHVHPPYIVPRPSLPCVELGTEWRVLEPRLTPLIAALQNKETRLLEEWKANLDLLKVLRDAQAAAVRPLPHDPNGISGHLWAARERSYWRFPARDFGRAGAGAYRPPLHLFLFHASRRARTRIYRYRQYAIAAH